MFADLIFLMLASVLLLAALGVVVAKNPMYCVLCMVLAFFNAAGLFILMGAEFLGLLLVMVYVGAIAVMFLFVLMTINIDFAVLKDSAPSYLPIGLAVAGLMAFELLMAVGAGVFGSEKASFVASQPIGDGENITSLGDVLFTNYAYPFLAVSMILLIGMVGAIVLTHRRRSDVRRQNITEQIERKREDAIEMKKVPVGKGVAEF